MRVFELVPGLGVNFHKINLDEINVKEPFMQATSRFWSCGIGSLTLSFLGIYVRASPRRKSIWSHIMFKIKRKPFVLKGTQLCIGGRVVFIKFCPK